MERDPSPANADPSEWYHARASMISELTTCTVPVLKLRCKTWNFKQFCNNCHQLVTDVTFKILMHCICLWCKNVMVFVSLDSPSCEVPCLILHSVVYRDVTRQAKRLHCLKYVGAHERGLAYLSRCNSGWFCHICNIMKIFLSVAFEYCNMVTKL
jgi:hypothetical protein